jgi:S1-C subfamily serine protease
MRNCIASLVLAVIFGPGPALAQVVAEGPPEIPPAMEEPGPPLGKDGPGAEVVFSAESLRDLAGDLPTSTLSRITQQPVMEETAQTRDAADAHIYRTASPSVVLVATKDGLGSGSLVSPSGEILTNWHVVMGFSDVGIVFKPAAEGRPPAKDDVLRGHVVKYDEVADLALVKVAYAPVGGSFLRLGDASDISIGLDVHAIGHPTGEAWTYTKGIISQYRLGFEWKASDGIKHKADVIQTQTPINPGNSGGPLISESGTLIGVNSFKAEGEGLSFAVSVADVKKFLARSGNRSAEARPAPPAKSKSPPVPPAKSKCLPRQVSEWRNKENTATFVGYDLGCTGKTNAALVYPDDKALGILLKVDRNQDGRVDVMFFDFKRRGKWDMSWWDENFDGHWTLVGYHDDGSLKPSRFESYEAYRKRTAAKP